MSSWLFFAACGEGEPTTTVEMMHDTAEVNGTRLYYEATGDGPSVVLVSGGGTLDRRMWDSQVDAFARSHRVIRYDIRGIGRSQRPDGPFSHSDDLAELLRFLKAGPADVVGVSFGAAIAIDLALDHPDLVRRLVLAAPGLSSDKGQNLQAALALSDMARQQGLASVIEQLVGHPTLLAGASPATQSHVRAIYADNADVFASDFALIRLWTPANPPAGERLSSIRVPTLVLVGDRDSAAVRTTADRLTTHIAGSLAAVLPGSGTSSQPRCPRGVQPIGARVPGTVIQTARRHQEHADESESQGTAVGWVTDWSNHARAG